jgi:hypothetical protein
MPITFGPLEYVPDQWMEEEGETSSAFKIMRFKIMTKKAAGSFPLKSREVLYA